jgi:5'(3')-deoxyribonucleotidase
MRDGLVWHNYHIYYSDLNRLLLECVYPLLQGYDQRLQLCFWERHYARGPHLRVRMRAEQHIVDGIAGEFESQVKRYLISNPSVPIPIYSPEKAKLMLEIEEGVVEEDLSYCVNQILAHSYQRLHHHLASEDAADLLEHFLHDSMPLIVAILRSSRSVKEELLRLYFVHALLVTGDLPSGCVAYKSHWEGFAAFMPVRQVVSRIRDQYVRSQSLIDDLMLQVLEDYTQERIGRDPILGLWQALASQYKARTLEVLSLGRHITHQFNSVEEVRVSRSRLLGSMLEDSPFVRALFRDDRFMASIQFHNDFLWPRVLTNLLYQVVAGAGLPMLDKMSLCYFAHRAAETRWNCDLTNILNDTIETIVSNHSHRL